MKTRSIAKILGLIAFICGFVGICFWFSPAFDEDGQQGSLFQIAFAIEDHGYPTIWPMVIAFLLLAVGSILCLSIGFFKGTGATVMGIICFALLVGGGVMTLLVKQFFLSASPFTPSGEYWSSFGLGTGPIAGSVFTFIGAVFAFLSSRSAKAE